MTRPSRPHLVLVLAAAIEDADVVDEGGDEERGEERDDEVDAGESEAVGVRDVEGLRVEGGSVGAKVDAAVRGVCGRGENLSDLEVIFIPDRIRSELFELSEVLN